MTLSALITLESILFDEKPYPGIILDVDDGDVKTKRMASLRKKIDFFWPAPRDDINWYKGNQLLADT